MDGARLEFLVLLVPAWPLIDDLDDKLVRLFSGRSSSVSVPFSAIDAQLALRSIGGVLAGWVLMIGEGVLKLSSLFTPHRGSLIE